MAAFCLVLDRLHVGFLGCYGNAWIGTEAFDRLAAEGFVFDRAHLDCPDLDALYRGLWQSRHALMSAAAEASAPALASVLSAGGVSTRLLTDEPRLAAHPLAAAFDEIIQIESRGAVAPAEEADGTALVRFFAEAVELARSAPSQSLLWLHSGALGTAWDAPPDYRLRYVEADDPAPGESADVPRRVLADDADPDELVALRQAYAGQVALADECLGVLLDAIDARPDREESFVSVLSARGMPLGEHRRVGPWEDVLYAEQLHVPWIVRLPGPLGAADRSFALVQPPDVAATLVDAFGLDAPKVLPGWGASVLPLARGEGGKWRECIAGRTADAALRSLQTAAWHLIWPAGETSADAARAELFVKPDDRWEVNNVADRCRDIVNSLQETAAAFDESCRSTPPSELPTLDEGLTAGLE